MYYPPLADWQRYPVTVGTAATAVLFTAWTNFGKNVEHSVPWLMSDQFWSGEIWRAVTSCLIHGNPIHLLFNLMCLWVFGAVFERIWGSARFLLFLIFLGIGSSLAEYAFSVGGIGLSGVIYGLFGALWVLHRKDRRFYGTMDQQTVQMLVGWFFLCIVATITKIMPIANVAHGSGAILGGLLGYILTEPNKRRKAGYVALLGVLVLAIFAGASFGRKYVNFSGDVEWQTAHRAAEVERKGIAAYDAQDFEKAAKYFSEALEIDDSVAGCWYNLGLARMRLGNREQAREAFLRSVELAPHNEKFKDALLEFFPDSREEHETK
jgi:GlpG protein